jgi:hypothetical protein
MGTIYGRWLGETVSARFLVRDNMMAPQNAACLACLIDREYAPVLSTPVSCPPQQTLAETDTGNGSCAILVAEMFDWGAPRTRVTYHVVIGHPSTLSDPHRYWLV